MTDKGTIRQVLGCLMQHPQFLSEIDKYSLSLVDFSNRFERYIFCAIDGLWQHGSSKIEPIDIVNYLESDAVGASTFQNQNGIEYLQDAIEFSQVENFDYYYNKLKKLNLLRDLKKQGFDTSVFYEEDLTNPKADEINANFELLTTKDICDGIKAKLLHLENNYAQSAEVEVQYADDDILDFIENMNDTIEIGCPVQGHIYNQIMSGAQKDTLTIRSGSSGLGKTRQAVGDACYLAYPTYYNSYTRQWEQHGSSEKVLFIVTEQTIPQVKKMILAYLSDISDSRFKFGNFTHEEITILHQAAQVMEKYKDNFIIIKIPNPSISLVKNLVRENCLLHNIGYVFYDYIFIGPSLLNEFKGFSLRNDEVLLMFATALKDLATELHVAVMTSTQVNAMADDNKTIRNEASLAGGRATINKADNGAIMARPTKEELEILNPLIEKYGHPNCVTDIFKVRNGEWTQVRIWSEVDLGRLKKRDLFVTDQRLDAIEDFFNDGDAYEVHNWDESDSEQIIGFINELNGARS